MHPSVTVLCMEERKTMEHWALTSEVIMIVQLYTEWRKLIRSFKLALKTLHNAWKLPNSTSVLSARSADMRSHGWGSAMSAWCTDVPLLQSKCLSRISTAGTSPATSSRYPPTTTSDWSLWTITAAPSRAEGIDGKGKGQVLVLTSLPTTSNNTFCHTHRQGRPHGSESHSSSQCDWSSKSPFPKVTPSPPTPPHHDYPSSPTATACR